MRRPPGLAAGSRSYEEWKAASHSYEEWKAAGHSYDEWKAAGRSCGGRALLLCLPVLLLLAGCMNRTDRLFQRAEMFLAQGQPELAANEYYRLATKFPRSRFAPNALYKLAYLHREEFGNPQAAIQTYQWLADHYDDSPYADEAWLWILQIQGEKLKDTAAMRRTRDAICERFAQDQRVCAAAQLQFARSLLLAGHLQAAEAEAKLLMRAYPQQERQSAAAMLILARITEQRGGKQSDQAVRAYEQIVNRYPNTASAVEAKRAIGWLYYGKRGEQIKAEAAAQARATRMLGHVPAPASVSGARLKPFACLASLLGARGVNVAPEDLLVVCGAAFDFGFDSDRPDAPRLRLPRNALSEAAEAYGFSVNLNTMPTAEASFAGLTGVIGAGHPVAAPLSDGGNWWIVTGYKPGEDRVYVLEPGSRSPRAVSKAQFIGRWARGASGHTSVVTGPYLYLSLGARGQAVAGSALLAAVARGASEARPAVSSDYRAFVQQIERGPSPDAVPAKGLRRWAERLLPDILAERQAIARFLKAAAPEAAAGYEETVRLGQQLRQALLSLTAPSQGAEAPADVTWPEAAELARQMQAAEERALQQLAGH